jgi:ligand-binding SRPBCC domain-containing protein
MADFVFTKETIVPGTPTEVWEFHEEADTFRKLLPPFERTVILQTPSGLEVGALVRTKTWIGPVPTGIEARITKSSKPDYFEDEMLRGPFAFWQHRHEFLPGPTDRTTLYRDVLTYRPPLGFIGRLVRPFLIAPRLKMVFDYRHQVVLRELVERYGEL